MKMLPRFIQEEYATKLQCEVIFDSLVDDAFFISASENYLHDLPALDSSFDFIGNDTLQSPAPEEQDVGRKKKHRKRHSSTKEKNLFEPTL